MSKFFATFFGLGYLPRMPGTWGSLGALPFVYVSMVWPWPYGLAFGICLTIFSIWCCGRAETSFQRHDASEIVLDEVVGLWFSLLALPQSWPLVLAGFVIFRLLDMLKPPPIYQAQKLPGGWGIVMDDLLAGVLTNLILRLGLFFIPQLLLR